MSNFINFSCAKNMNRGTHRFGASRGKGALSTSSDPQILGIGTLSMEPAQLAGHDLPVLVIGHAEPLVSGVEHGDLQSPRVHLLIHHHRQQALGLDIVPGLIAQEVLEIIPRCW